MQSHSIACPLIISTPRSGATYPIDQPRWCGTHQAPLLLTPLPGLTRTQIDTTERSLWRYRAAFPFPIEHPISLGEGATPLVPRTIAGAQVLLKCEWFNPTCSFKDRGASVMLSLLRAQGIDHVLEDSSGNGGAAVAAYAAAGGMKATIMAPDSTSPAKTVQMRAHGAGVELVPGTRQDTADAAVARAGSVFYASHNWHPFFLHGDENPGLRIVGGSWLPRAGQHHRPMRRGVECPWLRDRFFRTAPVRPD